MPRFDVHPIQSDTFRNEEIKDYHWIDGVQYGPCSEFVHNDYTDNLSADRTAVEKSFPETMGMSNVKQVVGINI